MLLVVNGLWHHLNTCIQGVPVIQEFLASASKIIIAHIFAAKNYIEIKSELEIGIQKPDIIEKEGRHH